MDITVEKKNRFLSLEFSIHYPHVTYFSNTRCYQSHFVTFLKNTVLHTLPFANKEIFFNKTGFL